VLSSPPTVVGSAPRPCYGYAVGAHPMDRPPGARA
jgi:hypothetical protein